MKTLVLKAFRDLRQQALRSILVVSAIAISSMVLGVVLLTEDVLDNGLRENFLASQPAEIRLKVNQFPDSGLDIGLAVEGQPYQLARREILAGEILWSGGKERLLLFIVPDFNNMQVDKLRRVSGDWSNLNGIVLERQSAELLAAQLGQVVTIKVADREFSTKIEVLAYDATLPQSTWENIAYAYISKSQAVSMGLNATSKQLALRTKPAGRTDNINEFANSFTKALTNQGIEVYSKELNLEKEHPHSNITKGMFLLQLIFAILISLFSSVLIFNLVNAMLARERKQIALMRAIGARFNNILNSYFLSIGSLALMGLLLAIPIIPILSDSYSFTLAGMLNIDILPARFSLKSSTVLVVLGFFLPLSSMVIPCIASARRSIQSGFQHAPSTTTTTATTTSKRLLPRLLVNTPRTVNMAINAIFRAPIRNALGITLLCVAGLFYLASFNVSLSMRKNVELDHRSKQWDLDFYFNEISNTEILSRWVDKQNEVETALMYRRDRVRLSQDKLSSSLSLSQLPTNSNVIQANMIRGEWLSDDERSIVLDQKSHQLLGRPKLGSDIRLYLNGQAQQYTVIGIIRRIGPAEAYTRLAENAPLNAMFIMGTERTEFQANSILNDLKQYLRNSDVTLKSYRERHHETEVIVDHFAILFALLFILSLLALTIAANGLALNTSLGIHERRFEFACMRAIGASPYHILRLISVETLALCIAAFMLCLILSLPLNAVLMSLLGQLLIGTSLQDFSHLPAYLSTLPILYCVALIPALLTANSQTRYIIRDTLRESD